MTAEDEEHLSLLSVFHYVLAGVTALCALFPVVHLLVGTALIHGTFPAPEAPEVGHAVGWIFVTVAGIIIVTFLALSACLAWAGRSLQRRRRRTFCMVVAGFSCAWFPFGTALGVFTLLVLSRPGVKAAFEER